MLQPWPHLLLFAAAVLLLALYGLTASGHFPADLRGDKLRGPAGSAALWGSMAVAGIAAVVALASAVQALPWYAAVIGGGAMLLFAPLLLRPFPDSFVNGRLGLILFSAGAAVAAALLRMAF